MPTMRLREDHPRYKQLESLFEKMGELGLSISFGRGGDVRISFAGDARTYELKDAEASCPTTELPPQLEYKLTYEKQ
jgi:hypothetical protein